MVHRSYRRVFGCGADRGQPRRRRRHLGGGHWINSRRAMEPERDTAAVARSASPREEIESRAARLLALNTTIHGGHL